jgi:hypothetical protein
MAAVKALWSRSHICSFVVVLESLVARLRSCCLHQCRQVIDARDGLDALDRLVDEVVRALLAGTPPRRVVLVAGEDEERQLADARRSGAADAPQQPEAVETGHAQIRDHHHDARISLDRRPARLAVGCFGGIERAADHLRDRAAHRLESSTISTRGLSTVASLRLK